MNNNNPRLKLIATNEYGDAFIEEKGLFYLIRPPLYKFRIDVNRIDIEQNIKSREFEEVKEGDQNSYDDTESLSKRLSENFQKHEKVSLESISSTLSIFVKCIALPSWRKHLKLSRHDRGNSELGKVLLVGINRLLAFETLSPTARAELADWRKKLEEMPRKVEIRKELLIHNEKTSPKEKTVFIKKTFEKTPKPWGEIKE